MRPSTRLDTLLALAVVASVSGCGDFGCNMEPLPGGALPADQTVEGGGQLRVTQAGFQKLTAIIPAAINDLVADGFCVDQGSWGDPDGDWGTGTHYCNDYRGGACGTGTGCDVDLNLDFVDLTVPDEQRLNVAVQIDIHTIVHMDYQVFGGNGSCNMNVDGDNIYLDVDIIFDVAPGDGELDIHLGEINDYDLSGVEFSNCGAISSFGNFARDFIESWFGQFIVDAFTPTIDDLVQGAVPDPLGIEGLIDVGSLLAGVSSGTEATMEARLVPGGYVALRGGGLSLGLITGLNADEDGSTRTTALDSEPHYCVPPMQAPNFAAPPASLAAAPDNRGTFTLAPAEEFLGIPDVADDLVMGLSETTLDLGGHHAVTSGALCLGVGTSLIAQLNLGTFSLLVPSLALLGESENPILLVTRPQHALDISIGTGTVDSPSLSVAIDDFEVDVYVYVYERYTRAFTMKVDLTIGVNLTFDQQPGMPATVTPTLVGLDAEEIEVTVLNSEFVRETPEELAATLPTIFDLAVGILGDGLGPIEVPDIAGFTLNNLRVQKVVTSEDEFVAIYASLGSSPQLRELGDRMPSVAAVLADMDHGVIAGARVTAPAVQMMAIDAPAPELVRAALAGADGGRLASVTLAVPVRDEQGRTLEHAWRLHGGPWRPFQTGATLTIADRAFTWQGKYTIDVRSRVVGDYTTTSGITAMPVIIDSVAPEVLVATAVLDDAGLAVSARDLVSAPTALRHAWGRPGDDQPSTGWSDSATLDRATLDDLVIDGAIAVWVRDEAGNVTVIAAPVPFHGQASESGCGCRSSDGEPPLGTLLLALLGYSIARRCRPCRRARKTPTDR